MPVEHTILYIAGAIVLSITASRSLLQESITLARLFNQLIEIQAPHHQFNMCDLCRNSSDHV